MPLTSPKETRTSANDVMRPQYKATSAPETPAQLPPIATGLVALSMLLDKAFRAESYVRESVPPVDNAAPEESVTSLTLSRITPSVSKQRKKCRQLSTSVRRWDGS